jgi:CBS-domain-containing membrane protein
MIRGGRAPAFHYQVLALQGFMLIVKATVVQDLSWWWVFWPVWSAAVIVVSFTLVAFLAYYGP